MTVASALPAAALARVGRQALASAGPDEDLADARGSSVIFRTLSRNRGPDLHEHIVTPTHDNTHDTVTDADTREHAQGHVAIGSVRGWDGAELERYSKGESHHKTRTCQLPHAHHDPRRVGRCAAPLTLGRVAAHPTRRARNTL